MHKLSTLTFILCQIKKHKKDTDLSFSIFTSFYAISFERCQLHMTKTGISILETQALQYLTEWAHSKLHLFFPDDTWRNVKKVKPEWDPGRENTQKLCHILSTFYTWIRPISTQSAFPGRLVHAKYLDEQWILTSDNESPSLSQMGEKSIYRVLNPCDTTLWSLGILVISCNEGVNPINI